MASMRTASSRILSQHINTIVRRTSTTSTTTTALRASYNSHTNDFCTAHRSISPSRSKSIQQTRSFTIYRGQRQREPGSSSSSSTNPTQTPASGSTPAPDPDLSSSIQPSKIYTFEDIQTLSNNPTPNRILIDVREPSEVLGTGRIPTAKNIPISTAPDSFFLPADEFEDRFGFDRPTPDQEVVFYCKAGVRSKAAARLAGQAGFGGKIGEFPGSWVEWFEKGGKVERAE